VLDISKDSNPSRHSFLYGILISLTSSVNYITTHAPVPNGVLKRKLNYVFTFSDFEDVRQKKLCIPDGLIINENKRFLIIPECKSAVALRNDEEPRINHQITSYSSKEFHEILHKILDYDDYEILVFTFSEVVDEMIKQLQVQKNADANIVMWALEEEPFKDEVLIRKVYGNHSDTELNQAMSLGVRCEPPAREFIDPDMPEPKIAYLLGGRLLCTHGECLLKGNMVITPSAFRKGNLDLVLSENKLRHFFRVLNRLVPSLGDYDKSGNISLKKHLDPALVSSQLSEIRQMTNEEYRRALGLPVEEETYRKIEKEIEELLKPKRTPKLEEIWGEKNDR
jgi:hypothetical protein